MAVKSDEPPLFGFLNLKTMSKELAIVDPKEFGIEEKQGKTIETSFAPKLIEREAFTEQYNTIIKQELNADTFKAARELRLKLVKVRTGIDAIHKTEKAFFLASGKYVDALKNKLNTPIEQMEEKLLEIEKYEEKLEAERKARLKSEREEKLFPFGTDTQFISLAEMTDEQFDGFLAKEKLAHETKLENERKAEEERIEAEKKAEAERLEAARLEAERIEAQRLENERLKKEAEAREKVEQERILKLEKNAEKHIKKLVKAGFELSNNDSYIDKQQHRYGKGNFSVSVGNLQNMTDEEVDLAISNAEKWIKEQEEAKAEQERLAKLSAELKAKEDAIKAEQEKERERIEAEEAEKIAAEKAKQLAPDKEKINALFLSIKNFEFPNCESEEASQIITEVKQGFELILNGIKTAAKTLK